jgi:hypothetical protein
MIPRSIWAFFAFLFCLAASGIWIGCLFTATETTTLKVVDSGLAAWFLFNAAKYLRAGLALLVEELGIVRRTSE